MADDLRMGLEALLRKADVEQDCDFLREGVQMLSRALMELEVSQHIGAERHERTPARTGQRNGYRERQWDTRVGSIDLAVPRVRDGSFYPSVLEPRKRAERALVAVVQEAYVQGVSTRRVDELVQALGLTGMRSARSAGCVRSWTARSSASAPVGWRAAIPTSGWTRPLSRCGRPAASSPRQS